MPLINRCGGGGNVPQLCGPIENFSVIAGTALTATLTWDAPNPDEDDSFVGTRIVRKVGSSPQHKNDGIVVYEGTALTYTDTGLTEGTTYYYRAFAYNAKKKYQTAMRVGHMTAGPYADIFSANSWSTIIACCQSGSVPSAWTVGDSKTMTINGASYQVDIIGKNYDTYADGGTAPLTFQLHDCLSEMLALGSPSWTTTAQTLVGTDDYRNLLPSEVKAALKKVVKSNPETSSEDTVSLDLFLLSEVEVFGAESISYYTEYTQYEYYSAGNSKVKKCQGGNSIWWLRDWYYNSNVQKYMNEYVEEDGTNVKSSGTTSGTEGGVSFGFCF